MSLDEFIKMWNLGVQYARSPSKFTSAMIGYAIRDGIPLSASEIAIMNQSVQNRGKHLARNAGGKMNNDGQSKTTPPLAFFMSSSEGVCKDCSCSVVDKAAARASNKGCNEYYCHECAVARFGKERLTKCSKFFRIYEKKAARLREHLPDLAKLIASGE